MARTSTYLYNQSPSQFAALSGNHQERTMMSSASLQGSAGDPLNGATRHLRGLAALLMRVSEALAPVPTDSRPTSDGGAPYEADVWAGFHDVMVDLLRTSQEIQRLADEFRLPSGEPAPPAGGGDGADAGPSAAGPPRDLACHALEAYFGTTFLQRRGAVLGLV